MSKAALDHFGEFLIQQVRDQSIVHWEMILSGQMKGERSQKLRELLSQCSQEDLRMFQSLLPEIADTVLHYLLQGFDEVEDEIKITVDTGSEQVASLSEASDGLAGELYTEEGWIARFSEYTPGN
ncbi:hypothetical protein Enr10x_03750 [Gimesia panareensis]|uniref:Uncharacterized protein n=2 Tax=Gimesia panareensis TaxID=2527978 RepID=A0A517Q0C7_9PLAN|nr:hypothetical protein Enr10x_03750 [Gimesia panareensis]